MDRSKAAIAAVFGAVTAPKTHRCYSKLCFPGSPILMPSRASGQGRGKRAGFRGAPRYNLQAPRPEASRTSPVCPQDSFCSPEKIRERNLTAAPTYWASQCSQTQGFAGRRQVENENPFDAARRSDRIGMGEIRDRPRYWVGAEQCNHSTTRPRPSIRVWTVGPLPDWAASDGINHNVIG